MSHKYPSLPPLPLSHSPLLPKVPDHLRKSGPLLDSSSTLLLYAQHDACANRGVERGRRIRLGDPSRFDDLIAIAIPIPIPTENVCIK